MTQCPQAKLYRRRQTGEAHSETAQKIVSELLCAVDNNSHRATTEIIISGGVVIIISLLLYHYFIISSLLLDLLNSQVT